MILLVLGWALASFAHASDGEAPIVLSGPTMGTTYAVSIHGSDNALDIDALRSDVAAALERIDARMSTWRADSEITRFNRNRDGGWLPVSHETARVVAAAKSVGTLSGGAFDITVAPLVDLWGFGPHARSVATPSRTEIAAALERVGDGRLSVRTEPPALRKSRLDMELDLSGIAKGFAVDAVSELLDVRGIPSYLVEIGGELRAHGSRPGGGAWRVAIERPVEGASTHESVVALREAAIATSGDYRNYIERDGRRFSHTIDPRTGRPIAHGLASVSVIGTSAMGADALATAIMVMGPEEGYAFALREGLAVQLVIRSGDGFRVLRTRGFEALLLE